MQLSDAELARLATDMESDRVERKAALTDKVKEKVGQALCAFANDLPGHGEPGVLVIGIDDAGTPTGLPITDKLLQELADYRDQGQILPQPTLTVARRAVNGTGVAVMTVLPSRVPPVRYKGQVWIRVGPRRAIATPEEEHRLTERRRSFDLPYDARPMPSATLEALDEVLFLREYLPAAIDADVLARNGRSVSERLSSLRLATADGVPTAAGLILLAEDPTAWIPGAYIQFLRIDGTELADPIRSEKRLDGALIDVLRQLDELLRLNITSRIDITGGDRDQRLSDYPLAALQQLVRNAVMHRDYEMSTAPVRITWYDDRVEITSPGGPYGMVTVENFGTPGLTDYRNPTLAEAMRSLGYVQRFGAGLPIARRQLAENGNPELELQANQTFVHVTVRR